MTRTIEAITKHRGIPSEKNQTMKAVRVHKHGGPEVLQYEDAPRPQVSAGGEVLIRVYGAGVNPVDWAIRAGRVQEIFPVSFPWIPGWDLSGVVEEVGADVTKFNKGDEVFAIPDATRNGDTPNIL
jgi:NADPH:quinone reductase-like Zn-dependent oxidoreductase